MVLVGPSGCGKTTALRMVAGLEDISEGVVKIGERVVNNVPPKDRDIAMVFQSYALYPHLSVYDNIAFSLRLKREKKAEIDRRVKEAAHILGLEPFLKRKPRALSGGQRQRVAMGRAIVRQPQAFLMDEPLSNLDAKLRVQTRTARALSGGPRQRVARGRAIVREPQAFLMDEPLSNLDAKLRVQMRAEISQLQDSLGTTTIDVTHAQVEAMTMGDRIAVMRKGELQQVGRPQDLYDRPVNLFVGGFIGSPAMNMFEARLARDDGGLAVELGDQRLALDAEAFGARPALRAYEGKEVILGLRPEHIEDAVLAGDAPADRRLRGTVELTEALGSEIVAHISVDAKPALTEDVRELAQDLGEELEDEADEGKTTLVGRIGARSSLRAGETAELAVDTGALHFFDPGTGAGIYDDETTKGAS